MGEPAIEVHGLGKRYRIGSTAAPYRTIRESLTNIVTAPWRRLRQVMTGQAARATTEDFWALRDVDLEVKPGSVTGIIGRNGSGKSTLLKILSRITPPTEGEVFLSGRVGSLLEVGTGFHPELTGRENIYLNGAILGMSRREVRSNFDEIVSFSEVARFLDTPVKHYSSGMYVRLAFAVAAHLETEIMLVDEVLAVGDAAFQRRCLGKMEEVAKGGRTVLFVSHRMSSVRNLCDRVVWLDRGAVARDGPPGAVTEAYLQEGPRVEDRGQLRRALGELPEDPDVRILDLTVGQRGAWSTRVLNDVPLEVSVDFEVRNRVRGLRVYFDVLTADGTLLIRSFHDENTTAVSVLEPGRYRAHAQLPGNLLAPRAYELRVRASVHNVRTCTGEGIAIPLDVVHTTPVNAAYVGDPVRSLLQPSVHWELERGEAP